MSSRREAILGALFQTLDIALAANVRRNEVLPEKVPASGLVILRDGDPGEPDVLLSPPEYVYAHRADIEVVVDGPTPAARDGTFDSIMLAIGAAIALDRTLGGLCDYIETVAPEPIDLSVDGAPGLKAAVVPLVLHYGSGDPLS